MRTCEDGCNGCDECTDRCEPGPGCNTPAGCRENGCLGWCDEHRPDPVLKPDIAALKKRLAEDPAFAAQVTGDRPPIPVGWSDPSGELAKLHADLRDFLLHVIDMSKGDHYWDVVRLNAEALLRREALKGHGVKPWGRSRGLTAPDSKTPNAEVT